MRFNLVYAIICIVTILPLSAFCTPVGEAFNFNSNTTRDAIIIFRGEDIELNSWGTYNAILDHGKRYFTGYDQGFLYDISDKNLAPGQMSEILRNSREFQYMGWDGEGQYTISLEEGYELAVKGNDGNKIYLELSKNGQVVDSKVVSPLKPDATIADKTYYYNTQVGDAKSIATIAVHLQSIIGWPGALLVEVDAIWQISENP